MDYKSTFILKSSTNRSGITDPDQPFRQIRTNLSPSIEVAKKIADALEVTLDYLVGEGVNSKFDKSTLKRIEEIQQLEEDKKKTLFDVIDTFIRESKGRKAFAH